MSRTLTRRSLIIGGLAFAGLSAGAASGAYAAPGEPKENHDSAEPLNGFGRDYPDRLYYCVSYQGKFADPTTHEMIEHTIADYARISAAKTLALYFHGGLVDKDTGLQWAGELFGPYFGTGDNDGNAYPYFFVWHTGWGETALALWRPGSKPLSSCCLAEDRPLVQPLVSQHDVPPGVWRRLLSPDAQQRVDDRRKAGRDHGVNNTEREELLRSSSLGPLLRSGWHQMKAATACAFQGPPETHVGSKLIQQFTRQLYDRGKYPRITLIGHSAGAIFICELLEAMEQRVRARSDQHRIMFDVVFMAPAVRFDRFACTLSRIAPHRIRHFRMYGLSDALESEDTLFPQWTSLRWLYTRSLPYFISGLLEEDDGDTPLLGMQRFFPCNRKFPITESENRAIEQVVRFLCEKQDEQRIVWSRADGGPGLQCGATRHGGMAGEPPYRRTECFPWETKTLQSVCYLLRRGNYLT